MVECIALTNKGLEDAAKQNIIELLQKKTDRKNPIAKEFIIKDCVVTFDCEAKDLCMLAYKAQAVNKLLLSVATFDFSDEEDIIKKFSLAIKDFRDFDIIKKDSTFRVELKKKQADETIDIQELEKDLGNIIDENFKQKGIMLTCDLKHPDARFFGLLEDTSFFLGIDISGDISKREYKIFNSPLSLKGTTAFGLLKIAGYDPKFEILNTFCNSGTIEIEAALYSSKKSHRFYDKSFPFMKMNIFKEEEIEGFFKRLDDEIIDNDVKITASDPLLRNLNAAKKNAKVAGVEKYIDFRRIDIDWLDTKFKKKTVDKIITFIPGSSKHTEYKNLEKVYKEFFYQAEYIIKDKASVVVLCISQDILLDASKELFENYDQKEIYSGEQLMHVLFFRKKTKSDKD